LQCSFRPKIIAQEGRREKWNENYMVQVANWRKAGGEGKNETGGDTPQEVSLEKKGNRGEGSREKCKRKGGILEV